MADHIKEYNMNNTDMVMAFSVNVKKEEEQNEDFTDNKFIIPETVIIANNPELQDNLICNNMKLYNISSTLDNMKTELLPSEVHFDMVHDNLKIEESNSANDMKIEFNNGLLYCEDCHTYYKDYCAQCGMLIHILNRTVLVNVDNTSREELPNDNILQIQDYFGEFHIFASKTIPIGVKFGPFTGLHRTEHSWKIKGGKFVMNKDKSSDLNWMHYIKPARHISEQNLLVFQYECNLYYHSTRQIEEGEELLVYFGEEYEDSLDRNIEMDFIPTTKHIFKDAFACTFCCLGFSSKSYLVKHKTVCPANGNRQYSVEELTQCLSCKIHLDQKEYFAHHMPYCERNDRKCILPTSGSRQGNKTRQRRTYKCQQCKYKTKYKGDLKNHTNQHYEVKMYKCGVCCKGFKRKADLRLHVENTQICANVKEDSKPFTEVYINAHIKTEPLCLQDEIKQFNCSLCQFRTKYKRSLIRHMATKHLKEFNYKCDKCDYRTNRKTYLKMHIETKHLKEFKYKCDTCEYKTNQTTNIKRHIETRHMKELKYKCDTCDFKANLKSNLKKHIEAKHLKVFKYKCDQCSYKANRQTQLKTHIETKHLKEFKYKCDTCEYKTNQTANLKLHIEARHLKVFKYKCGTCDYKANWKAQLKAHIDTKHLKEFKYKCDECDYKANQKSQINVHIKRRHLKQIKYKHDTS